MAAGGSEDIRLVLTGEDAGASKAVRALSSELDNFRQKVTPLSASFSRLNDMSDRLRVRQAALRNELANTSGSRRAAAGIMEVRSALGTYVSAAIAARAAWGAFRDAGNLGDMANELNETPEALQRVQSAAIPAGASIQQIANSFTFLEKALGDVENKKVAESLANLGVSAEGLAALPIDKKMLLLSDAFEQARANGTGVRDIMALLGRGGKELIGVLGQGSEEIKRLFGEGKIVSNADIAALDAMNDRFDMLTTNAKRFAQEGILSVVDGFEVLMTVFGQVSNPIGWGAWLEAKTSGANTAVDDAIDRIEKRKRDADEQAVKRQLQQAQTRKSQSVQIGQDQAEAEGKAINKELEDQEQTNQRILKMRVELVPQEDKLPALESGLQSMLDKEQGVAGGSSDILDTIEANQRVGNNEEVERLLKLLERVRSMEEAITSEKKRQKEEADKLAEETGKNASEAGEAYDRAEASFGAHGIVADSLTEVGGGGGGFAPSMGAQEQQLNVLRDCRDYLKSLAEQAKAESDALTVTVSP